MKRRLTKMAGVVAAAVVLAFAGFGCSKSTIVRSEAEPVADDQPPWQFVEGRGVRLSDWGKEIAELELAEVGYTEMRGELAASGRIFSRTNESGVARATVALPAEKGQLLEPGTVVRAWLTPNSTEFTGRVERLDGQAAGAVEQVELIVAFDDPHGLLPEGAFLSCRIAKSADPAVITVPASAILRTARGDSVYVRNGDYFFRSPVRVGSRNAQHLEIIDGLFEGDIVASAGQETLWLTELQAINGGAACADGH